MEEFLKMLGTCDNCQNLPTMRFKVFLGDTYNDYTRQTSPSGAKIFFQAEWIDYLLNYFSTCGDTSIPVNSIFLFFLVVFFTTLNYDVDLFELPNQDKFKSFRC